MRAVAEELPMPNAMCIVQTLPRLKKYTEPFRYITYSDGTGYFWDNLLDEILQDTEVTHWEYCERNQQTTSNRFISTT